ncbi:MAG: hypothetical protein A3K67_04440 [Euryarchaeota archaeon RBG_16_62_10]|nr:MAG: hypothetical protein A3K67_04440 [Euryarchaeota archaeon RBG_16_62_10]
MGAYQAENAACAVALVEELAKRGTFVSDEEIRKGLLAARWPGRLEVVSRRPLVVFDGSHNPDGVATTVRVLGELDVTPLTFVLGCMDDKDARGIVRALTPAAARIVATQARYKRALRTSELARIVREEFPGPSDSKSTFEEAFDTAEANLTGKGVCVIGSLYLVGEAIQMWRRRASRREPQSHKV